jgi:ankyrin repeat protein
LLPHDPIAQSDVAKSKLEILESAQSLKELGDEASLMSNAYKQLWETNARDERRKCHQIRMFQFVLGALDSMTPRMLLEAICFDPDHPTKYDRDLEIDYIEKLYHNFLRNKFGDLVFEHVSAKAFILEQIDQNNQTPLFANEALNHSVIARTSLLLLQNPEHPIWVKSGIDWSKVPLTLTQHELHRLRLKDRYAMFDDHLYGHRDGWTDTLGTYIMEKWYLHCSRLRKNDLDPELSQEMSHFCMDNLKHFPTTLKCLSFSKQKKHNSHWVWKSEFNHCLVEADNRYTVDPLMFTLVFRIFPSHCADKLNDFVGTLGDIMGRNQYGKTALHIATQYDGVHSVKPLLEISLQLNQGEKFLMAQNHGGETALHIAVQQDDLHSVEALLKSSRKMNIEKEFLYAKEDHGKNALHFVKSDAVVRVLLHFEGEIAPSPITPGAAPCQERLLDSEGHGGETPAIEILKNCSEELVLFIFSDPYATFNHLPGTRRAQSLTLAIGRGFKNAIRSFLDHDAGINSMYSDQGTALMIASSENQIDVAKFLLDLQADVNAIGGCYGTALGVAAWKGHLEIAELLIQRGANVNAIGGDHGTALTIAAFENHTEIMRLLLQKGADVNAVGGPYGTALGASISQERSSPFPELEIYNFDIDLAIREWPSEVHWAKAGRWSHEIASAWARYGSQ